MRIRLSRRRQREPVELPVREVLQRAEESLLKEALTAAEKILPNLCTFSERAEAGPRPVPYPGR